MRIILLITLLLVPFFAISQFGPHFITSRTVGDSSGLRVLVIDTNQLSPHYGRGTFIDSAYLANALGVGGAADGNGIYDGNGTVPGSTVASLTDSFTIGSPALWRVLSAKIISFVDHEFEGGIIDNDGNLGSAGQVLSSTGTEINWVDQEAADGNGIFSASNNGTTAAVSSVLFDNNLTLERSVSGDQFTTLLTSGGDRQFFDVKGSQGIMRFTSNNSGATAGNTWTFFRSRGSVGAESNIIGGDVIMNKQYTGYISGAYASSMIRIRAAAGNSTLGASNWHGSLRFETIPENSTTISTRLEFDGSEILWPDFGSGTVTGNLSYLLGVTSASKMIEIAPSTFYTSIEVDGVAQSTGNPTLDFDGIDFSITESPTDDFDITIDPERIEDITGAMVSGNTETGITVTYQDADGTIDFVATDASTTNEAWTIDGDDADTELISNQTVLFAGGTDISTDYDPATNTMTFDYTGSGGGDTDWTINGADTYVNPTTQTVGIGLSTPDNNYQLDVSGDVYISSQLYVGQKSSTGGLARFTKNAAGTTEIAMFANEAADDAIISMATDENVTTEEWSFGVDQSLDAFVIGVNGDLSGQNLVIEDNSGNQEVGIGVSPSATLHVLGGGSGARIESTISTVNVDLYTDNGGTSEMGRTRFFNTDADIGTDYQVGQIVAIKDHATEDDHTISIDVDGKDIISAKDNDGWDNNSSAEVDGGLAVIETASLSATTTLDASYFIVTVTSSTAEIDLPDLANTPSDTQCKPGQIYMIENESGGAINIDPNGTDVIDALTAGDPYNLADNTAILIIATSLTTWKTFD